LYGWGDPVNTLDVNGEVPVVLIAGAMSYARCVATCTALEGLITALSGECDLDLPDLTGDCALDCLNPLNWAGIGKAGDLRKIAKSESDIWKALRSFRDGLRTNGKSGRERRYYEWDHTHGDIEVYNRYGNHLGSMDPVSGAMVKPPIPGRSVKP
jgi:hypothetical protein